MHILFVTPVVPSPSYGRRPYNFIRHLCKEHQVYLAAFLTRESDDMPALRHLAEWGVIVRTVPHPAWRGVMNCALGLHRGDPLRALWIRSPQMEKTIQEMVEQYPIEIVHFDRMRMGHFGLNIDRIPCLVDFTDALMLYLDRTRTPYRSAMGRLIDLWERRTIPAYEAKLLGSLAGGLCCSTVDQAVFRQYHPSHRVEAISNSVDSEHFVPRLRENSPPRLVFTGTFSYFPNVDSLFYFRKAIWPELRRRFPELGLDIIGARPPEEVRNLGREPGIRVLADVPDMADYLFSQDLFICPLRVASGMRNKVLEAMAAGMTVISTTIGVEGLEVEPERHYLRADSEEEFVQQTERALKSPDLRNKVGVAGREYTIRNHSGQAAGEALLSLYGKLIGDFTRSPRAKNGV